MIKSLVQSLLASSLVQAKVRDNIGFDWQLPVPAAAASPFTENPIPQTIVTLQIPADVRGDKKKEEERAADLKRMQELYQNAPWEFTITQNDNLPTLQMYGPRSAKFSPDFHRKADYISRQLLNESANVLIRGASLVQSTVFAITDAVPVLPIKTLDDLSNLFSSSFSSKIPPPSDLKDWQTDKAFGEGRLTWGGYALKRETLDVLKVHADVAKEITGGETVADLLSQGRLYAVDFTGMGLYSKNAQNISNPLQQSVPSTYGQFYLAKDGSFMPLAIKVVEANNLVFTPKDSPEEWMFAKLAFSTSEAVFHPVEHFNVCHWNLLGMRTEAFRHLHHSHPVSALIQHHYQDSYGIVADGIKGLLQAGVDLDRTFGSGGKGAAFAVQDRDKTYDFSKQKYRNTFKLAGTDALPGYKYRDDLLAIHKALALFAKEYLSHYYKSDANVHDDVELQAWAAATADPEFGGMKGFPTEFKDLDTLTDTLADLITFVTTQHNILNGFGKTLRLLLSANHSLN